MKTLALFILALLLIMPIAHAQELEVRAGTTPDSALYGLDRALERVKLSLIMNKENKAIYKLQLAEERLAELKQLEDEGKAEKYREKLIDDYSTELDDINESLEDLEKDGKNITATLARFQEQKERHLAVLNTVLEKVPEQAKASITKNIEKISLKNTERSQAITQKANNKTEETFDAAIKKAESEGLGSSELLKKLKEKSTEEDNRGSELIDAEEVKPEKRQLPKTTQNTKIILTKTIEVSSEKAEE